ncbi:MAG: universal stress protein [Rhodospirillaceae bacterium]|nr:universal stress protein [Rhodospirillaceae bacterium]
MASETSSTPPGLETDRAPDASSPTEPAATEAAAEQPARAEPAKAFDRVFLVVVDNTPEMAVAIRYACRRALHTGGRVALVHVIEPADFQHWLGVGELIQQEARQAAEQLVQKMAAEVYQLSGSIPVIYIREGERTAEILKLLQEEPGISILVLAAATGNRGPGPLVTALTGRMVAQMRVPITVVPGNLTPEAIDKIA